jgi:hypothetical protein
LGGAAAWANRFVGKKSRKNRPKTWSLMRNGDGGKTRQKPTSGPLKCKEKPPAAKRVDVSASRCLRVGSQNSEFRIQELQESGLRNAV